MPTAAAKRARRGLRRAKARMLLGAERVRGSAIPLAQCAVAAGGAWLVAVHLVGHPQPFFAPIAAVVSLGASLGARLRRGAELIVGVSVGVFVGDLLISWIGSGWWQIALVVLLATTVAVFADGGTVFVAQAGANAVLVATLLPPGQSGGINRFVDALVGGAVGLLVVSLLPVDPVGQVRGAARALLEELAAVLQDVAAALRSGEPGAASAALARSRASQPAVDTVRAAISGGAEAARVSPFLRTRKAVLARYTEVADRGDYAMRNARVLARRTLTALQDGEDVPPALPDLVSELAAAVGSLTAELGREGHREDAREPVLDVVRLAVALDAQWTPGPSEIVMLAQLRSIMLDLLQATGLARAEAQTLMRGV